MLKTSINLYFSNKLSSEDKLNLIKKAGYDEFFTGISSKNETLTWKQQIDYAKSIGLNLTMIHCQYHEPILDNFWLNNADGDWVENSYAKQIESCGSFTKNFVIHLNGNRNAIQSEIGLERIKRLLKVCEKYDVNLAVENLYTAEEIPYIFNNISHPLLKICFDCGHQNFLTKNFDLLKEFGKYVSVLHINDNNGQADEHKVLGTGNIDIYHLAKELTPLNVVLSSEIRTNDDDIYKVLLENKVAMDNLQKLMKKRTTRANF